jgi:homoprotocatechuate degradation regulator HpaR
MNPFAHRNLPRLLLQARESVLEHFRPGLREHGLTDQQWRVLRVLAEEEPCDVNTIAQGAFLLGPSLSGMLARMEQGGLIVRTADPLDARRQLIRASAKGKRLVDKLAESIEAHYSSMEARLGKARLLQLYGLLDEVIAMNVAEPAQLMEKAKRSKRGGT